MASRDGLISRTLSEDQALGLDSHTTVFERICSRGDRFTAAMQPMSPRGRVDHIDFCYCSCNQTGVDSAHVKTTGGSMISDHGQNRLLVVRQKTVISSWYRESTQNNHGCVSRLPFPEIYQAMAPDLHLLDKRRPLIDDSLTVVRT